MAIDVASQLFGKVVPATHWKVVELMLLDATELQGLHKMAKNKRCLAINGKSIRHEF